MKHSNEETTLADRLALDFGSGVMSFITATILWVIFYFFLAKANIFDFSIPFSIVWFFAVVGFILGALTMEDYVLKIVAPIWRGVYKLIKKGGCS